MNNKNVNYKFQNEELINYRVLNNSISNRKNKKIQDDKSNLVLSRFFNKNEYSYYFKLKMMIEFSKKLFK